MQEGVRKGSTSYTRSVEKKRRKERREKETSA